jgi:Domain of Unknown Function with PDB structure (DUF3857)/Transglutaminase-like superfamily
MIQKLLILFFALSIITFAGTSEVRADDPLPVWLQEAAKRPTPSFEIKDVPGVVLHDEQTVTLNSDGNLVTTTNYAVRVLERQGKSYATAVIPYLQSASKVRELKAWLIRHDGTIKYFGKDSITDRISDPDDIYNEYREKFVSAADESDAGVIFGYQATIEERPLFTQDIWAFQGRLPTLVSRYTLNLPADWQAKSVTFNHATVEPSVNGNSYIWELRDLAPIPPESSSPSIRNLAPRVAINYFPKTNTGNKVFASWQDVSRWGTELHNPQVTLDDSIAGKARELTANAATELDKIRAIGAFVQNLQYISVDIGIANGNGYKPRPASLVLQRGYGDCKDKANLMRAMLRALKIEAYPVFIFSGDPTFVREEWSSPSQFNHCIIAIKVSDDVKVPSIITHATLGRLLIFDATDPHTLVGDFPDHEQNSFALIAAGDQGGLARMPIIPSEFNKLERNAEVTLDASGNVSGIIREQANGQTATDFRREFRSSSITDYNKQIEGWVSRGVSGAKVSKISPKDNLADGKFDLEVEFNANSYAQLMQNRLMVFKPAVIGRLDRFSLSNDKRVHPYLMDATAYTETIKIKLPQGFVVDEIPDPTALDTAFGKYNVSYEVKDGYLLFNRSMTLNKTTVPSDKYNSVRNFFAQVRSAEQSPVVLVKQ